MKMLKSMFMAVVAVVGLSFTACNGSSDSKDKTDDKAGDKAEYIVIDFNAEWCGPCKMFAPVFEAAAEKYADVEFKSVNIDENPEIANQFGVESIPMVVVINSNGDVVSQNVGFMDADEFDAFLTSAIGD